MKPITKEMLRIYKCNSGYDWMNYHLVRKETTYHHIIKRSDGGKDLLNNGALLMPKAHEYLHIIEYVHKHYYELLNMIFKIVNNQYCEPNKDQREAIEFILQDFEYHHMKDTNSKGKRLIKPEYLKRWK